MLEFFAYLNSKKDTLSLFVLSFPLLLQRVSLFFLVSPFLLFFSDLVFPAVLDPSYFSLKRFFVGVCRVAESEGRVLDLGGFFGLCAPPPGGVFCFTGVGYSGIREGFDGISGG
jgi:hypothetical protein